MSNCCRYSKKKRGWVLGLAFCLAISNRVIAQCQFQWDQGFGVPGVDGLVYALISFDDGGGSALYAGGNFSMIAGVSANRIAKWNGASWSGLGSGIDGPVQAFVVFDDGGGPALYAGGAFTTAGGVGANYIAKWGGASWSALESGMNSVVYSLTVFDVGGGPALYVGGAFTTAGGNSANYVAKWDGVSWSALGSGMDSTVTALAVFDDGGGPALYAGGFFTNAGGVSANRIAKWNGAAWSSLGSGISNTPFALAVFDDGGGPALYAGGNFATADGITVNHIAKWNGVSWSALGLGMSNTVWALADFDDGGSGASGALYAGGDFTAAGGVSANHIAKWDGASWSALGSGLDDNVLALTDFDDGGGPTLYAGGFFTTAGGLPSTRIAKWGTKCTALDDHFDNGALDPQWAIGFGANANGWTFSESGTELTVTDISTNTRYCNNQCLSRGNVMLTRSIPQLSDFDASFDFSWDSLGTFNTMQIVTVYLIGVNDSAFAFASYVDSWGAGATTPGRQQATIAGNQFIGPNNLPDAGPATIEVTRTGSNITTRWNGTPIHSGTDATFLSKVRIEFSHYDEVGSNGGGVPCPEHPTCNVPPNHPASTFGILAVDHIQVTGTPSPIRYVDQAANGLNNGSSWGNAYRYLQDALADAAAVPGSVTEIWVAKGTYKPDRGGGHTLGDRTATFQLLNGVAIYGGFNGTETLRSQRNPTVNETILTGDLLGNDTPVACSQNSPHCDSFGTLCVNGSCTISNNNSENSYHVITGSGTDNTAVLDGFTITAGNANVVSFQTGSGMYNLAGSPTVNDCTLSGNSAFAGSGIFNGSDSAPTLTNSALRGNWSSIGGALYNNSSDPSVVSCTFSHNASGQFGAAMQNFNGSNPIVINSRFFGNSSPTGGAVYTSSGNLTLTNCVFSGNTGQFGAAMANAGTAILTVKNSTFCRNSANATGGGIHNAGTASVAITNCILWENSDGGGMDESAQIQIDSGTPTVTFSIVQGGWSGAGGNNLNADPKFFDANGIDSLYGTIDDDLRLRTGSLAINAGSNAAVPADTLDLDGDSNTAEPIPYDLVGKARFVGTVDIGAIEYFPDCNNNGIIDSQEIANAPTTDCTRDCCIAHVGGGCLNAAIQTCVCGFDSFCCSVQWDASCVARVNTQCGGCSGSGIPDECEIADCTGSASCSDCNLNAVPDSCDDPSDSIPNECASFTDGCTLPGQEQNWNCGDNWDLGGQYPDNDDSAPGVYVTLPPTSQVFLNETVTIPSLRMQEGSELDITAAGAEGDLHIQQALEANGLVTMLGCGRSITSDSSITIGPGGVLEGIACPPVAGGSASAITSADFSVVGSACFPPGPCPHGGSVTLTESMQITTGDLLVDGTLANGLCELHGRPGDPTVLSFHTPPNVRFTGPNSGLTVNAVLSMAGAAGFLIESVNPLNLGGDWDNQSVRPDCFEAFNGKVRLNGSTAQSFEVAATDSGGAGASVNDFRIGTLEIAANASVTLVDGFDNNLQGQSPCSEAQYVDSLVLEAGSTLTVNNCRLYFNTLVKDPSAQIVLTGCGEVRSADNPGAASSDPSGLTKSRTLSFLPGSGAMQGQVSAIGSPASAIRVFLDSLHHVVPPYNGGPSVAFTSFEGQVRWVGPPAQYVESTANPVPFTAAQLQCTPHYRDWNTVGLLHVFGSAIVPSSVYRVQTVAASCQGIEDRCTAVSALLTVTTTRWGDVIIPFNPPDPTTQPDLGDVSALVNKFRSAAGAPIKARALLAGDDAFGNFSTNTLSLDFSFTHIAACVDSFRGKPYPSMIQACP